MEEITLKECQKIVRKFVEERNWNSPPNDIVMHMLEELGEIAREILRMQGYGGSHKKEDVNFGEELGDMFYLLLKLSNTLNMDISQEFLKKLEKNRDRFPPKTSIP
ncbi:MAG: hypothetical protein KKB25_01180 [Nanoarchaeota archaeon]|nr:hypothetical protein [Nanoarchaeota archaeon]